MESRQSRMQKYYDNNVDIDTEVTTTSSRAQKNQRLYKEVSSLDLKEFDLNSNVSVIGENTDNISLDEIKDILSEKYKENPRRKSIGDTEEIELPKINLDETREYDINAILEKAKDKKEIGVAFLSNGKIRRPISLTTAIEDFKKATADQVQIDLNALNEPVVLVLKKNVTTLRNLRNWLLQLPSKIRRRNI